MDNNDRNSVPPGKHFEDFSNQSQLSPRVRRHLSTMYGHLAVTFTVALFACYLQVTGSVHLGGLLGLLPAFGGLLALFSLPRIQNETIRQLMLYLFGFLEGLGLSPTVNSMHHLPPSVLLSALAMTVLIFVSFSATALLSPRRSYLYLGSIISSGMTIVLASSLLAIFMNSPILENVSLYGGLLSFALLITFNTQAVVERVESTLQPADPIVDSANMLMNMLAILRRLLMLMAHQQEALQRQREEMERRKRDRRGKSE